MNTVKKGDAFEKVSLEIIGKIIERNSTGLFGERIIVGKKKAYFSNRRNSDIIFDLTIEVWAPGATRYSLVYFIECKDYSSSVPVNDLEEFVAKIQQVSGINAKGIFISSAPLQSSALSYAESMGLMVIKGDSKENYEIILHKGKTKEEIPFVISEIPEELTDEGIRHLIRLIDKSMFSAMGKVIAENNTSKDFGVPTLSRDSIEQIAHLELNKIDPKCLIEASVISVSEIEAYVKEQLGLTIELFPQSSDLLGACSISKKTIWIHPSIKDSNRYLFILAHEIGHYLLHTDVIIDQDTYEYFSDPEINFVSGKTKLENPKQWIEWQANCFASEFVLPKAVLYSRLVRLQRYLKLKEGIVYLDDQPENRANFFELITLLSKLFHVSKTSVIYKLKEMNLLKDNSRLQSIGQIIAEYFPDLLV